MLRMVAISGALCKSAVSCALSRPHCAWQPTAPELPVNIVHQYQDAWPPAPTAKGVQIISNDRRSGLRHAHGQQELRSNCASPQDRSYLWVC